MLAPDEACLLRQAQDRNAGLQCRGIYSGCPREARCPCCIWPVTFVVGQQALCSSADLEVYRHRHWAAGPARLVAGAKARIFASLDTSDALASDPQAGGSSPGGAEAEGVQVAGHAQQLGQMDGQEAQKGKGPALGPGAGS